MPGGNIHWQIIQYDHDATRYKQMFDHCKHNREYLIAIDKKVLIGQSKSTTKLAFNPFPFVIVKIKGSMIIN